MDTCFSWFLRGLFSAISLYGIGRPFYVLTEESVCPESWSGKQPLLRGIAVQNMKKRFELAHLATSPCGRHTRITSIGTEGTT